MVELLLNLRATHASRTDVAGSRLSLAVGAGAALGLWLAPDLPTFAFAWALFFGWVCVRAASGERLTGLVRVPFGALGAGALSLGLLAWPEPPVLAAALVAALVAPVFPLHLWVEDLRRRLTREEFQLFLLAQPGVAYLHRSLEAHPALFEGEVGRVLLPLFVVTAILQSGLGLVRKDPMRAVLAITLSQTALLVAGTFAGEVGWAAARMMLVSTVAGSLVLFSLVGELRDVHGVTRLANDHGLADAAPDLHRVFVTAGWLFVGLPGGLAFFAEDALFHALLEHSVGATLGLLLAVGLNAVVFYRVYAGIFCGSPRVERPLAPELVASRRRYVLLLTAVTLVLVLGGVLPWLFA